MAEDFINKLKSQPDSISFAEAISHIEEHYQYTPSQFENGLGDETVVNSAGSNEGSCKIFAFAQLNGLSVDETLSCFGDYYRKDVLENPEGTDHANIRNFIKHGWDGIRFQQTALSAK